MTDVEAVSELVAKLNQIAPLATKVAELKCSTIDQETAALESIMERIKPLLAVTSANGKMTGQSAVFSIVGLRL